MPTSVSSSTARSHASRRPTRRWRRDGLGDLIPDREHRIERRHWLLEDHAHAGAAHGAHLVLGEREQIAAVEPHVAADDAAGRRHQAHERQRRHALAAARLADQAEDAPGFERERHAVDGPRTPGVQLEVGAQIFDLEQ